MELENGASLTTDISLATCAKPPNDSTRFYICRQHLAALLANIPAMSMGIALGWSAPAVPILLGQVADAQPLRLTLEQASWVGGLMPLASLGGALVAGPLAERLGRKGALLLGALPTLLGWLLMTFAGPSLQLLLAGRVLTGVAAGAAQAPIALYCEEIAAVRVRGALGTYMYLVGGLGLAYVGGLACLLPYFWFNAASLAPPLLFLATFCWMPESPGYLAARGHHDAARRALRWLRGPCVDYERECEAMLASTAQAQSAQPLTAAASIAPRSLAWRRPWRSNALRALATLLVLMFLQQMSGVPLFLFYTVQVFQELGGSLSSYVSSFLIGLGCLVPVILTTATVDRVGRRMLLISSSLIMNFCLVVLIVYTYLLDNKSNLKGWDWIPLAALLTYIIVYSIGLGPVPWFLMAELLPMYAKSWACPAVVCMNRLTMFLVAKVAPNMLVDVGQMITYIIFSVFCVICAIFIKLCVPETKGLTKEDILERIGGDEP